MDSFLDFVIVIVLAQISIYISRIIIFLLTKQLPPVFRPYMFLVSALFPFYKIIRLVIIQPSQFFKFSVFYFWVIFLIGLLALFITELKKLKK